jgi:hypothetical protein
MDNGHMGPEEIRRRLNETNRAAVSRDTGLPYMYLARVAWGKIKNPGSQQMDKLRTYFLARDVQDGRPQ